MASPPPPPAAFPTPEASATPPRQEAATAPVLDSTAGLPSDDEGGHIFRFSMAPSSVGAGTTDADAGTATNKFVHDKATAYLARLSSAELLVVLRVLKIRGKMQAPMPVKRGAVLDAMEQQGMGDEELECLVDDELMAAIPSPMSRAALRPAVRTGAASLSPTADAPRDVGQGGNPTAAGTSAGTSSREPSFSGNDAARLAHVVTDPAHFQSLRVNQQPMTRAELDKERAGLWKTVLAPAFNNSSYAPVRPQVVDGVLVTDLRLMDPNKLWTTRDPSKLEMIYRALRSEYTTAYANYSRSGQLEGGVFKVFVKGDHRLLYLHCLLHRNPSVDFLLRTLPLPAQTEVGLPDSDQVGQGPAHSGSVTKRKRARTMEITFGGMDALASVLTPIGKGSPGSGRDVASEMALDVHDNAEAVAAVWKQLRIARAAEADDHDDEMARTMRVHLERQMAKLLQSA